MSTFTVLAWRWVGRRLRRSGRDEAQGRGGWDQALCWVVSGWLVSADERHEARDEMFLTGLWHCTEGRRRGGESMKHSGEQMAGEGEEAGFKKTLGFGSGQPGIHPYPSCRDPGT